MNKISQKIENKMRMYSYLIPGRSDPATCFIHKIEDEEDKVTIYAYENEHDNTTCITNSIEYLIASVAKELPKYSQNKPVEINYIDSEGHRTIAKFENGCPKFRYI